MDSFSKCVFVRAGKHTSVHDMHPHSNITHKSREGINHMEHTCAVKMYVHRKLFIINNIHRQSYFLYMNIVWIYTK